VIPRWNEREAALFELLGILRRSGYRFITPTPRTHAIVLAREPDRDAGSIHDVLGWSRPFLPGAIDGAVEDLLTRANVIETAGDRKRATVRVSSLNDALLLHSAFPTTASDSVFFGPDSYRFARFLTECLAGVSAKAIIDIGCGTGVGGIVAAKSQPSATIALTDINAAALQLAGVNAAAAGVKASLHLGDVLADTAHPFDLAISNPPYIMDPQGRVYRDGGDAHGAELSLRITRIVLERLSPHGRFILYTGSAIVGGTDHLFELSQQAASDAGCSLEYHEIDPDVFGEELAQLAYAKVDRIAAVGAVFHKR